MPDEGPPARHRSQARGGSLQDAGGTRDGATPALSGQVALVTGASTGIGRHLVEGLAARGASVVGLARGGERLAAAMDEVTAGTGARTLAVAADVTDRDAVDAAVARATETFGRVDLLVNNAGLMDPAEVPVWEADPDEWWAVVTSHIRGAHLLVRAVVPGMVARGSGRVVNVASGLSTYGGPIYTAYSVGKTGLMRLTEDLVAGLPGTGVQAFDVSPGVVRTDMTAAMSVHRARTDWTDPGQVVELVAAIADGQLDAWSGRFLRVGVDAPAVLGRLRPHGDARRLRLRSYGDADPLA